MKGDGKWIWLAGDAGTDYNEAVEFATDFTIAGPVRQAAFSIAADSWYRLRINGKWAGDGPGRSWPEHYRYDVIDVAEYLQTGRNTVEILVRYFGCGTFHQLPRRGGLIFELEVDGQIAAASCDGMPARRWTPLRREVPKVSVQQEPVEYVDLRRIPGAWGRSRVIFEPEQGPWRDLQPRDCLLLSRVEKPLTGFVRAMTRSASDELMAWSPRRLMACGSTDDNNFSLYPALAVRQLALDQPRTLTWQAWGVQLWIDGELRESPCQLEAGSHLMIGVPVFPGHHDKECAVLFQDAAGCRFSDPERCPDPLFVVKADGMVEGADIPFCWANTDRMENSRRLTEFGEQVGKCRDFATLQQQFGHLFQRHPDGLNLDDRFFALKFADPQDCPEAVSAPEQAMARGDGAAEIRCQAGRAADLLYDFGEETCGYWECEIEAPAGTHVVMYSVEYIREDGVMQHTGDNHNVLDVVCPGDRFSYLSLKRRAGRYLLISFAAPEDAAVKLYYLGSCESTYPFHPDGHFHCSDSRLNRLWEISARTLKLCMEDTFTDCPLYEQTLWVGDARNESIFAFWCCGAYDLVRRCIRLTGESLERFPIAGCQTPSCWNCLLPAWSFMWGMSVEDYWYESGDLAFIKQMWGYVKQNLDGARKMIDPESGLFASREWNLFEWNPTDNRYEIMVYNSQFLDGAIQSALRLAEVVEDRDFIREYKPVQKALRQAINRTWMPDRKAYAEVWENGAPLDRPSSVHTSILALLYDEAGRHAGQAARNLLEPREDLIRVYSAFASFYTYLALEKLDEPEAIVEQMLRDYQPMLDLNATTVWETYPGSIVRTEFPTRSHCHAWSSAPLCFLNEVVTGIRMVEPGAAAFEIAPAPVCGLTHAAGVRPTVRGPVTVIWQLDGEMLIVFCRVPKGVKAAYRENRVNAGYEVSFSVEEY